MKKKTVLIPALSGLLISTSILASHVSADEATTATTDGTPASSLVASTDAVTTEVTPTDAVVTDTASDASTDPSAESGSEQDTSAETQAAPETDVENAEVLAAVAEPETQAADEVTILHTNDIHGRIEAGNGVIGMANLAGVVEEARSQGTTLVLDSGDAFQGLPISNSSEGEDMANIMNQVGYDAMTLGNHEFDFGLDQLKKLSEILTFPLISSNVYVNGARLFEASTIIDKDTTVEGDEFVVIGVTTPETATKTHPKNVEGVSFTDPITEVNKVIEQIEANAAAEGKTYNNYIILAHLGVDTTTPVEWQGTTLAQALAKNEQLTDKKVIVLDGHSHTLKSETFGNVTYNQTGSYLNNIGKVTLNSEKILSAGVITADEASSVTASESISKLVGDIQAKYAAENAVVVLDNNPVELNGKRENVRVRETNLGNVVADALLDYGQAGFTHKSNLAVTNGGGLRETIKKDQPVTKGDIIAVLPFGNIISQIEVTGQQIYDMFVKSLGSTLQEDENGQPILDENGQPLLEASGGFLQVAGVQVMYDTNLPADERILDISIWNPEDGYYYDLDLDATYYLATNDFLAAGGDGYTMLGGAREEGPSMDVVFADYLANVDLTEYEVVNPNSRTISISSELDTDGDGFPDYIEMIYGTSVTDAKDYPGASDEEEEDPDDTQVQSNQTVTVPVSYNNSVAPTKALTAGKATTTKALPATNSEDSMLAILLGMSILTYGAYGIRRKTYGK